ncbi:hypothetical protein GO491_00415 [Flavobacteriaceae bacterium Ap0902]|nr:hypothetical protein [Flavobacteriaceae bacterium Ap0902]
MRFFKYILPITAFLLIFSFVDHDFHTSTTKIELNSGSTSLNFTSKFVTADLEEGLGVSLQNEAEFKAAVERYLKSNFTVKINGVSKSYNFASVQTSPKATRLYFEIPNVGEIKSIEIRNAMLVNVFADQQNFMTFSINGKRDNFVSRKGNEVGKINL